MVGVDHHHAVRWLLEDKTLVASFICGASPTCEGASFLNMTLLAEEYYRGPTSRPIDGPVVITADEGGYVWGYSVRVGP